MRFNLLRSTTALVCLSGLVFFAHAALADSSSSSGNAVSARTVKKPTSVDGGTLTAYKTSSVDDGSLPNLERHAHGEKPNSVDDGTLKLKPGSVDDASILNAGRYAREHEPSPVDVGSLVGARRAHGHKTSSVDGNALLTKRFNNAHEDSEDSEIRNLLDTGVDVLAAKRVVDTKTRGLGQVSYARTRQQ